jgi:nicotinamidase-related amidase
MPIRNDDLHGSAPDTADVALLVIDVINDFDFPEAEALLDHAKPVSEAIAKLKQRAQAAHIPIIYVNDNFGRWRSDFRSLVAHCTREGAIGKEIVERLQPDHDDYIVIKPKHSAFFSTTLDTLLCYLRCSTLIMTGFAGNICVLFSANDAYMRDFELVVPADCVASNTLEENHYALKQMQQILRADIRLSTALELEALKEQARRSFRNDRPKVKSRL